MSENTKRLAQHSSRKPDQKVFAEPSNGSFRDEPSGEALFSSLTDAREKITSCIEDYNQYRPHGSLGNLTLQAFTMSSGLDTKAA